MRTPYTVIGLLLVGLTLLWVVTEDGDRDGSPVVPAAASVAVIAERVEALRDLRFQRIPRPVTVSPRQAEREGLADLDRRYPVARRRADEEIYKLLGLLEPGADLRELSGSLFGEGVAGYYDPRDGRLRIVSGSGTGTRVLEEMVLAHELTHALEDQRFGLPTETAATDDRALARVALHEGTATSLMYGYVQEHFSTEEALGGLLGSAFQDTGDLPPFIEAQVLFGYLGGEQFVADLLRRAGGSWALVDTAYRLRPPSSTEQVLHPHAYFGADEPAAVPLRAGAVLGRGWKRVLRGTWGELQTRELLASTGDGGFREAAAGWGGDRYELWRSRPIVDRACAPPCGDADVLVMRWRWDTERDEAEFARGLRAFAASQLGERPAAVTRRNGLVTLAIAPSSRLARRVAGAR